VLRITRVSPCSAHVFTLHAELEGLQLLPQLEWLLSSWISDGCCPVPMRTLAELTQSESVPYHLVELGEVSGRSGVLAVQGRCLADAETNPDELVAVVQR